MSRRTERIGRLMQQKIGQIVMRELSDPRIETARTSITRVRVQEDLLRAKVYVSILGTQGEQHRGLEALRHATGRIQALLRRDVSLRHMPVLEFLYDEQYKGALRTWEIIRRAMDEVRADEAVRAASGASAAQGGDPPPAAGPTEPQGSGVQEQDDEE